jgi:protein-serine/threonine kinase
MTTPLLRRMWGELCRAVGWLHGVCIVHRDIKLESKYQLIYPDATSDSPSLDILLTVNPFTQPGPIDITQVPQPLIKLTDFGLARFIDPSQPMLTTRCGSETYAAPEIVLGSSYDGRQTDAWACGIVLYALAVRSLPFDPKATNYGRDSRRKYFVRIASAEYSWPEDATFATEDLRKVVARLLVRDANKRAKIVDLWEEDFMLGEGAPNPPWRISARRKNESKALDIKRGSMAMDDVMEEEIEDDYENGMLLDAHDINSIASQETH